MLGAICPCLSLRGNLGDADDSIVAGEAVVVDVVVIVSAQRSHSNYKSFMKFTAGSETRRIKAALDIIFIQTMHHITLRQKRQDRKTDLWR